jgi:DNA-binding SARP family transcriptional activator
MKLQLLGPVCGWIGQRPINLGVRKQRFVLAVLALEVNALVPTSRLVDLIWPDGPPASGRAMIHTFISGLRAVLDNTNAAETVGLLRQSAGYELRCDPMLVDAHRFLDLTATARTSQDDEQRVVALEEALGLWQGPALSGVTSDELRSRLCDHLDQARLTAAEERVEAMLRLGRHDGLVDQLTVLVAEHPNRQRLTGQLMLALSRIGRTADALHVYEKARRWLADELGIDPDTDLQQLHTTILRGEPAGATAPAATETSATSKAPAAVPRQLPAPVHQFIGRVAEQDELDRLADAAVRGGGTVVISAVGGTAGVGKTALAVHWAHRVADTFPDGQLYVNLRGFGPAGAPTEPATAVRGFLDALGVASQRIPAGLDAQAALYRSLLADRRMLVVLDNARDTAQVRPLLPGASSCLVLVTSRNRLTGLVAAEGAYPITLDVLTPDETHELLARRLGAGRTAAEPDATKEISTACARLPLALAIVAARAGSDRHLPLAALAAELRAADPRLDTLTTDDPHTDVRAVFSWSYQALTPEASRLFRHLGLHPGPDLPAPAAASLTGLPLVRVRPLLAELTSAHLLAEPSPGRYTLHDLLRAYASEQGLRIDDDGQRRAATRRMLDFYLQTAHTAARLLNPTRDPIPVIAPHAGVTPERPADHERALEWFAAEHANLLAVVDHAAATEFHTHTWQLAWALANFLGRRGHWHDWAVTQRAAVAAAGQLNDPRIQAQAHTNLARAYTRLNRIDDAQTELRHALDLTVRAGDLAGQAHTRYTLANVCAGDGRQFEALTHSIQAMDLYQAAGHRRGRALALNAIGWCHALLGDHRHALTACQQALALFQELDDRLGEAHTWDSLGYAHHHLAHHAQAITSYQHALNLLRDLGDRYEQADTLAHLGDAHHAAGSCAAARAAWQEALDAFDELDHPDADNLRTRIAALDTPGEAPTSGNAADPRRLDTSGGRG